MRDRLPATELDFRQRTRNLAEIELRVYEAKVQELNVSMRRFEVGKKLLCNGRFSRYLILETSRHLRSINRVSSFATWYPGKKIPFGTLFLSLFIKRV